MDVYFLHFAESKRPFAFKEDLRMEESRWSLTISPDRLSLSIKNGCFDAINRAYIIYTTYR